MSVFFSFTAELSIKPAPTPILGIPVLIAQIINGMIFKIQLGFFVVELVIPKGLIGVIRTTGVMTQ